MGSPSSRLKTPEKLRPWLESGLEFVFNPGGVQSVQHPEQAVAAQPTAASSQQQPVPSQSVQQQVVSPQSAQQMGQSAISAPVQSHPTPQQQPVNQAVQQKQPAPAPPASQAVPQSGFPEPWASFFSKTPAQPKVVWTYMELGLDLAGQSDPKRGAVLRNLLAHHLKWPPGTTAFWPVAALKDNALQPDRNMFWRGWDKWKTPYIACFGDEALRVIYPDAEPGGTTYLMENVTIFVLPPLSKLITMLPHEQQLSVEVLKNIKF